MTAPNLASRPFLNTRPVWLLTVLAGTLTLALAVVNLQLWLGSNRTLADEHARRGRLVAERRDLEEALQRDMAALDSVPWRSLQRRVSDLNQVLREHAFSWVDLLDDVERVIPRYVRIVRLTPSVDNDTVRLAIGGIAQSREDLLELLDNLIADPAFVEPRPSSVRDPEDSASAGYEFSLMVRYQPGGGS